MGYEKIVQNVEEKMLNNKNEVISVLPIRNFNGGYMKKTYNELIEDISPDEIDELYYFLEEHKYLSGRYFKRCGSNRLKVRKG